MNSKTAMAIGARNYQWAISSKVANALESDGLIFWCDYCLEYHVNDCDETLSNQEAKVIDARIVEIEKGWSYSDEEPLPIKESME